MEDVCKLVSVRELSGIKKVHLLEEKGVFKVQTEGVNFNACWGMSQVNPDTIKCNDIQAICSAYGVDEINADRSRKRWFGERSELGVCSLRDQSR